jgi:hypothetical protein
MCHDILLAANGRRLGALAIADPAVRIRHILQSVANAFAVAFLTVIGTTSLLTAQRTWIVDVMGGAGSHYRDVQSALNVASPSDLILIRPGATSFNAGFTVTKGVTITTEIRGWWVRVTTDITVRGIPRGQMVSLKNLTGFGTCSIILEDNQGTVYLEKCQTGFQGGSLVARRCSSALFNEVVSYDSRIESSYVTFNRGLYDASFSANPLLWVSSSVVVFGNSILRGSWGGYDMFNCRVTFPPGDAIAGYDSVLILGAGTSILGGRLSVSGGPCPPVFIEADAIRGSNLQVFVDPTATLTRVTGTVRMQTSAQPTLDGVVRDEAAGLMDLDLLANPGSAAALIASPPAAPQLSSIGMQWIDLAAYLVADVGLVDQGGHRKLSFYMPPLYPLGHTMVFQSAVLDQGRFLWSTPSAIVRN